MLTINVDEVVVAQAGDAERGVVVMLGTGHSTDGCASTVELAEADVTPKRIQLPGEIADDVVSGDAKVALRRAYEVASTYGADTLTLKGGVAMALLRQATADLRHQTGGTNSSEPMVMGVDLASGQDVGVVAHFADNLKAAIPVRKEMGGTSPWGSILLDLAGMLEAQPGSVALTWVVDALTVLRGRLHDYETEVAMLALPEVRMVGELPGDLGERLRKMLRRPLTVPVNEPETIRTSNLCDQFRADVAKAAADAVAALDRGQTVTADLVAPPAKPGNPSVVCEDKASIVTGTLPTPKGRVALDEGPSPSEKAAEAKERLDARRDTVIQSHRPDSAARPKSHLESLSTEVRRVMVCETNPTARAWIGAHPNAESYWSGLAPQYKLALLRHFEADTGKAGAR